MSDQRRSASDIFGAQGWCRSSRLRLLDFDVAIHSPDPTLVDLVDELYAPLRIAGDARHALFLGPAPTRGRAGYFTALDGSVLVRTPARSVAFAHLLFEANQQAVEQTVGMARLHASAAALDDAAVVMPGAMGAGKSTLVAGLMTRGFGYLTDEVVAFDPNTGTVVPYPKPLSLGTPPESLGALRWEQQPDAQAYLGASGVVPPGAVGSRLAHPGVSPGLIVLPNYEPSAPTEVVRLTGADALAAVAGHTFHLEEPGTLARLSRRMEGLPCYRLVSGDLQRAIDAVLDLTGQVVGVS